MEQILTGPTGNSVLGGGLGSYTGHASESYPLRGAAGVFLQHPLVEGCFWGIHSHDFLPYPHGAQERTADREWWVLEVGTIGIFQNSKY